MDLTKKLFAASVASGGFVYDCIKSICEGKYAEATISGLLTIGSLALAIKYGTSLDKRINQLEQTVQNYKEK